MGYRIDYEKRTTTPYREQTPRIKPLLAAFAILLAALGIWYAASEPQRLTPLLPGDPAITAGALDALVENWQQGLPLDQCIRTFCQEIVAGAGV